MKDIKEDSEVIKRLRAIALHAVTQLKLVKESIRQIQDLAKEQGYKVDEQTGELIDI